MSVVRRFIVVVAAVAMLAGFGSPHTGHDHYHVPRCDHPHRVSICGSAS